MLVNGTLPLPNMHNPRVHAMDERRYEAANSSVTGQYICVLNKLQVHIKTQKFVLLWRPQSQRQHAGNPSRKHQGAQNKQGQPERSKKLVFAHHNERLIRKIKRVDYESRAVK